MRCLAGYELAARPVQLLAPPYKHQDSRLLASMRKAATALTAQARQLVLGCTAHQRCAVVRGTVMQHASRDQAMRTNTDPQAQAVPSFTPNPVSEP